MEDTEEQVIFCRLEVQAHRGHGGVWEEPAWIYWGQNSLIAFWVDVMGCGDKGGAMRVVYLDFTEAFDMLSCSVLVARLLTYGLDK